MLYSLFYNHQELVRLKKRFSQSQVVFKMPFNPLEPAVHQKVTHT